MNLTRTQQMVQENIEADKNRQRNLFPCNIHATLARERVVVLEDQDTGRLISAAMVLPHSLIYRIPTAQSNFAFLLTGDDRHTAGIPILYDRNWIEPRLFATGCGELDGG
ncbi:MAG: hypothetical protein M1457_03755 [bacterium]|nr:hypothetical protein [bacterium]